MGVNSRRPPLPAPTESMDDTSGVETEVATTLTSRTDKTSYSIPEDGSPVTIATRHSKEGPSLGGHGRHKSQTSLLIEYFEAGKNGDKARSRPSVRVKVTPSAHKKSRSAGAHDAIQITGIGKDRKPSYTRRISLGSSKNVETGLGPTEATEASHSSGSNLSSRPPIEIEVLNHQGSDVSNGKSSRGLLYAYNDSNVSSMPPDSLLDGSLVTDDTRRRDLDREDAHTVTEQDHLSAPIRTRSRSTSKDRITQKVMEKLGAGRPRKSSRSSHERSLNKEYDADNSPKERRRRSSKSQHYDEETVSGAESSLVSSHLAPSQRSYRSGTSQGSRMTNNPKLLEMVEDTIKRVILPEIIAIKEDQKLDRNMRSFAENKSTSRGEYEKDSLERRMSKSSSTPHLSSKPKVVLNRDGDDLGIVLSRGDSERKKTRVRKSSRGSYTEERPSSRRSSGRRSRQDEDHNDEENVRLKSSQGSHGLRDMAAADLAAGALTSAALKHHDSYEDVYERHRKRSKSRSSRSRSASITDTTEPYAKNEVIPPMPLASHINDSDVTRESIVSSITDHRQSPGGEQVHTPIREVSRGSLGDAMSPRSLRTPNRTPISRGLGMSHGNASIESQRSPISSRARMAALAAAGLSGAAVAKEVEEHHYRHIDADGYGTSTTPKDAASPVQSVSSLKNKFEGEPALVPQGLRPKSAASRSSAGRLHSKPASPTSLRSGETSPTTARLARSRNQSQSIGGDEVASPSERPGADDLREHAGTPGTPNGESVDEWYERQHQMNNRYRDSFGEQTTTTNRDSYQTNPYADDDRRYTTFAEDGVADTDGGSIEGEKDVRPVGAVPKYVHESNGAESNVASLMDPSMLSSSMLSSQGSPRKSNGTYADRMAEHLRDMGEDKSPAIYEGSTLSQTISSQDRWAAIKGYARDMSASTSRDTVAESPRHSVAKDSLGEQRSLEPVMAASSLPLADDPMPAIGHFDDSKSDVSTNPSIIHGPLGGDATGKDTWPYTPEPADAGPKLRDSQSQESGSLHASSRGESATAAAPVVERPSAEVERLTPDLRRGEPAARETTPSSARAFRDEGYVTDAHTRSAGALTPSGAPRRAGEDEVDDYNRAMDAQDLGHDDPFSGEAADVQHTRHVSGNSHGMASPLYDSATGTGVDRIQSKDIVALMDHLTVRDAQRNARDTEILVTLVRSAAETRQSLDEMKRFIAEQDRMIMQNTDRNAEQTVQKVLGGPRPQPPVMPRTPRLNSQEEVQTKRKNVLKRALKGLTGGKRSDDLAKVEEMLMQILENVESIKHGGGLGAQPTRSYTNDSLDSYERLRAAADSGYEPEGQAGTSSTPSHSGGQLSITPRAEKHQFHSGYDGRRGSVNRVSTVVEGSEDEDELEPHESHVLDHQFENNERMLTPTQEFIRQRGLSPNATPSRQAATYGGGAASESMTPRTSEKQRKHKSNSSSVLAAPKVSRWSKTTASSAAPDLASLDSPQTKSGSRGLRPLSAGSHNRSLHSRSSSQLDDYDDDGHGPHVGHRASLDSPRSSARDRQGRPPSQAETRSMRSEASRLTRTSSPLIPSEASFKEGPAYDDEREASPVQYDDAGGDFDDPKYQAHRNSLLLQHPQPRQGTTGRHQTTLETQAKDYHDGPGTNSDLSQRTVSDFDPATWGSSGTAALARNRFSHASEPLSPVSMSSPAAYGARRDDGPLVPQPPKSSDASKAYAPEPEHEPEAEPEPEMMDWDPQYSNSGFSKGGYYTSPYGSGHLLEPIEEVRYSLETDRTFTPEPPAPGSGHMRSAERKITGPRPMGARSPAPGAPPSPGARALGTVRRKGGASTRGFYAED